MSVTEYGTTFTSGVLVADEINSNDSTNGNRTYSDGTVVSAALEINSTEGALLIPRMTTAQRDALIATVGMIIYNTDVDVAEFQFLISTGPDVWVSLNDETGNVSFSDTGPANPAGYIASFADNTGLSIENSGILVVDVAPLELLKTKTKKISAGESYTLSGLSYLQFDNDNSTADIYSGSDIAVRFIDNSGNMNAVFTGGLPQDSSSPSALVELNSTTGCLLLPRLSDTNFTNLTSPVVGMVAYNSSDNAFQCYQGSSGSWNTVLTQSSSTTGTQYDIPVYGSDGRSFSDSGINLNYQSSNASLFITGSENTTTTGANNIALGIGALSSNSTGPGNTAFGNNSLNENTTEGANSAFGMNSLSSSVGSNNCAFGHDSLLGNESGANNSAFGKSAGTANSTGSNNTFLGFSTNCNSSSLTNATAIGANAIVSISNAIVLGDGSCNVGIGTSSPSYTLHVSGDAYVDSIVINDTPVNDTDGANKAYVDSVAAGLQFVNSCTAATTSNLSATYSNGTSGVGATLTSTSNETLTIDGQSPAINDRVLIKDQTASLQNGVYTVTNTGSGSSQWILTRATDFDTTSEVKAGDVIPVIYGTSNAGTFWVETATVNTIGVDAITFSQFGVSSSLFLQVANNLSDVANVSTSRINLGLTNVATQSVTQHSVLVGGSSNAITSLSNGTTGQLLTANSGTDPSFQTYTGSTSLTTIGTINTGTWNADIVTGQYGGTGVANSGKIITLGGSLTTSGSNDLTFTTTGTTNVTLPTGGTLIAGPGTVANKDIVSFNGTSGNIIQDSGINLNYINDSTLVISGTLNASMASVNTTGFGVGVLASNTSGNGNTAVGYFALNATTTTGANSAFGQQALQANITGSNNSGFGSFSLFSNTTGNSNTAAGYRSLLNTSADGNTAFGYQSGITNTTGTNNTFLGYFANCSVNNLTNATAIGYNSSVSSSNSIVLGNGCNVGIGTSSPTYTLQVVGDADISGNITSATWTADTINVSYGGTGQTSLTQYGLLVGNGTSAISTITPPASSNKILLSVASGNPIWSGVTLNYYSSSSMFLTDATGSSTGTGCSAFGYQTLSSNSSGTNNSAFGYQALYTNTSNTNCTAMGYQALYTSAADSNSAFGNSALKATTSGNQNSAFGNIALTANTSGQNNCAFGHNCLVTVTTNGNNCAFGVGSLRDNTAGGNTAFGFQSLVTNTSAGGNVSVGYQAGATQASASAGNNTFIGYQADLNTNSAYTNATAIGYLAKVDKSNSMVLGGTSGGFSTINVGIGTITPNATLHVKGGQIINRTGVSLSSTNYSVLVTDYIIGVTTLGSNNVVLPFASSTNSGQVYIVKDEVGTAGTTNITISSGSAINAASPYTINSNYGSAQFYSSGSQWFTF